MSAFFIAINRNHQTFEKSVAEMMMAQLGHFGVDNQQLHVQGHFALGFQSHWTVPEERGEQQPLYDQQQDCWLVFHGRIDNRATLFDLLGMSADSGISDAAMLLQLYQAFQEPIFEQIIGPFAFVLFSPSRQRLIAARDCMGGRYLVHKITAQHIIISTYEMAIVAHPSVDYKFNQEKLVRLLIGAEDDTPTSTIAGLQPLSPGQQLSLSLLGGSTPVFKTFYLPSPKHRIVMDSDQHYAQEFRRLFDQAVARRLRSIKPLGCMLSGGLDSVPIAISAATQLATSQKQIQAYSWVFDKYPEADERTYSNQVCDDHGIKQIDVNCDQAWPQFDEATHQNPIIPFSTPYSEFSQSLFASAQKQGVGVMLSGLGGDMLYTATEPVLYELLAAREFKLFTQEFRAIWNAVDSKKRFVKRYLLWPVMEKIFKLGFGKFLAVYWESRQIRRFTVPSYLSDDAEKKLNRGIGWLSSVKLAALRPTQYSNVVGSVEGEDSNYGRYMDAKYKLQRRYPFRDRELAEFMLAIPSQQLFFNLLPRPIVRQAFDEELPDQIKQRKTKTDFSSVIAAGIENDQNYGQWLNTPDGDWRRFVKQCYFEGDSVSKHQIQRLKWRCGYYEFWKSVCYNRAKVKLGSSHDK